MSGVLADLPIDVPNPIGPIVDGIGSLFGAGAGAVGEVVLNVILGWIAQALADAAKWVLTELFHFLDSSSTVNLDSGWWAGEATQQILGVVGKIALSLLLVCVLLAVIQGVLAGEPASIVKVLVKELPMSIFGFVATVAVVSLLLKLTDAASTAVLAGSPASIESFVSGFGVKANILSGGLLAMLLMGVVIAGAVLVWIELSIRSTLLYWMLALAPVFLAARVWAPARSAFHRFCHVGIALIVSKFAIALALALGAAALGGGAPAPSGDGGTQAGVQFGGMMTGASLMLLAAFTPFILLKVMPVAEAALVAQGISHSPARAAGTAAGTASQVAMLRTLGSSNGASRGSGGSVAAGGGASTGGGGGGTGPQPSSPPPRPAGPTGTSPPARKSAADRKQQPSHRTAAARAVAPLGVRSS